MISIGDITVKIIDNEYAVVKHNLTRKYIKLGFSETKYLFLKLEVDYNCEMKDDILPVLQAADLSDENKIFLDKKFEEWGFIGGASQINQRKQSKIKDISKIHLFKINPESFLNKIPKKIGKLYSLPGIITLFILSILKYTLLLFVPQSSADYLAKYYVSIQDVVLVFAMITITLMMHEVSHALACRYYGGKVTSMGMVLYFFTPCFFCDVSDIYLSSNKKTSFCVGFGGIVANLLIGNLSFVLYCLLASILDINLPFLLLFWFSNLGVVVFNLLPFVKLDGYWILSAVTGITNLMDKSVMVVFSVASFKFRLLRNIRLVKKSFLIIFGCIVVIFRPVFWIYSLWTIYDILLSVNINGYISIGILFVLLILVLVDQIKFLATQITKYKIDGERILSQL